MPFSTASYFAGAGTVFAAAAIGFAGAITIKNPTQGPQPPNRVERVAASTPLPRAAPDSTTDAAPAQGTPPSQPPQAAAQQQPIAQQPAFTPAPVIANDDDEKRELAKIREAQLQAAARKKAERRRLAERKQRQEELDAATAQGRQIDRDDVREVVVRRDQFETPRSGFFGGDN
jgi:hypothetical protein